ncbi:MAG: triose-phosphate isomerase [Candidatus Sphingomonas phytovorans]|nr:triose-phosphate isomerase [Sphingomonas sp.]WEK00650.1 MAG: triose-phosphate isomerase [Sphingomonas sp.]
MARRKLIAGNWKMNGSLAALTELDGIAAAAMAAPGVDVAIAVPATLIAPAVARVSGIAPAAARAPGLAIGAEDVHPAEKGAHTGCISVGMVKEAGAVFSIIGHSERRADCHETDQQVKAKAEALRRGGLGAILCVGETLDERDAGRAEAMVTGQLAASLPEDAAADWLSIAYEPVWAIGTGRTPTVGDVAAMHGAIRARLRALIGQEADAVRILYGGSVTGDNAAELLGAGDVDGALVGGASLTAAKFVPIVEAGAALG